jgi:hypothetical protein
MKKIKISNVTCGIQILPSRGDGAELFEVIGKDAHLFDVKIEDDVLSVESKVSSQKNTERKKNFFDVIGGAFNFGSTTSVTITINDSSYSSITTKGITQYRFNQDSCEIKKDEIIINDVYHKKKPDCTIIVYAPENINISIANSFGNIQVTQSVGTIETSKLCFGRLVAIQIQKLVTKHRGTLDIVLDDYVIEKELKSSGDGNLFIRSAKPKYNECIITNDGDGDIKLTIVKPITSLEVNQNDDGDVDVTCMFNLESLEVTSAGDGSTIIKVESADNIIIKSEDDGDITVTTNSCKSSTIHAQGDGSVELDVLESDISKLGITNEDDGDITVNCSTISKLVINNCGDGNAQVSTKGAMSELKIDNEDDGNVTVTAQNIAKATICVEGDGNVNITSSIDMLNVAIEDDGKCRIRGTVGVKSVKGDSKKLKIS